VGTFPFEWSDRALADPNSDASYLQYQSTGVQLLYSYPTTGVHLLKLKGMMDCFRNPRPNVYEAQMIYSPIQISNSLSVSSSQIAFPVQNFYSFTDLSQLTMAWKLHPATRMRAFCPGAAAQFKSLFLQTRWRTLIPFRWIACIPMAATLLPIGSF